MKLGAVRLSKLGIALDMVGLLGQVMAWMVGTWLVAFFLIYALVSWNPWMLIGTAIAAVVGLLIWWISGGIIRRKRFRTALAGILAVGLAVLVCYGTGSLPENARPPAVEVVTQLALFGVPGLFLLVATFVLPKD